MLRPSALRQASPRPRSSPKAPSLLCLDLVLRCLPAATRLSGWPYSRASGLPRDLRASFPAVPMAVGIFPSQAGAPKSCASRTLGPGSGRISELRLWCGEGSRGKKAPLPLRLPPLPLLHVALRPDPSAACSRLKRFFCGDTIPDATRASPRPPGLKHAHRTQPHGRRRLQTIAFGQPTDRTGALPLHAQPTRKQAARAQRSSGPTQAQSRTHTHNPSQAQSHPRSHTTPYKQLHTNTPLHAGTASPSPAETQSTFTIYYPDRSPPPQAP